jgi:hypothetical protein
MTRIAVGGRSPSGLKWPNYVNGRLLTAQDLTTDDDAVRRRDRWLGRAVGPGVAEGLEVTGTPGSSTLQVPPGTGVSLGGTAVHLDVPATLDLAVVSSSAEVDAAAFGDCTPPTTETKAPVAGPYLLVMRPGPGSFEDKVPVAGGPTATLPTPCTARWQVEDVEFAAIRLDGFTTTTTLANRRNQLAHWCFGSGNLEALAMSGFSEPVPYGGLAALAALADLDDCDLPLAVFQWTGTALTFVDRWSARRRPMRPSAATTGIVGGLTTVVDDTRPAEGEARFLQFQEQLAGLLATPAGASVRALDSFPLLPPAGMVPFPAFEAAAGLASFADFDGIGAQPSGGRAEPAAGGAAGVTGVAAVAGAAAEPAFVVAAQPSAGLSDLLAGTGSFAGVGGVSTGSALGTVSQKLAEMQSEIAALQAKVNALESQAGGAGPQPAAPAQAEAFGRKLAAAVVTVLADSPGALAGGVNPWDFFGGVSLRVGIVDHETVDFTIRRSWYDEPIDLTRQPTVNMFFVVGSNGETFAPYVLFTKKLHGPRWIWSDARQPNT